MDNYLGYIVSDNGKFNDLPFFVKSIKFKEIGKIIALKTPFIIVGYENAKKFFGERFSILDKNIGNGLAYWTFKKTERRYDFEIDLNEFYKCIIEKSEQKIVYYFCNIFKMHYSDVKKFILLMDGNVKKTIYFDKNMIYIYYDRYVLGYYMEQLEYIGLSKEKVLNFLNNSKNSTIIKETEKFKYKDGKIFNKKFLAPFYYSLKEQIKKNAI